MCSSDLILLAIEVAHTTLAKDLKLKAPVYAKYGVQELWVIDAKKLVTHIFRAPKNGKWTVRDKVGGDRALNHPAAPGFAIALADL